MTQFRYTALSPDGARVTGVVDAFNELDAAARVKETCDVILQLAELKDKGDNPGLLNLQIGKPRLNNKAFTVMLSQFSIILRAGIPIARTVHLIAGKTADKTLKRLLQKVADDVEGGRSLSASFEDNGKGLLPPTFIETLRAGEASGSLDRSFETMYRHFDKQGQMRGKVRGAMAYPIFVLVIAVVVVAVLMIKVVPTFMDLFAGYDAQMPAMTLALIAVSNFFTRRWMVLLAVVAAAVIALKLYGNTEQGRLNLARLSLKLPILGEIGELNAASQFANSMAAMLEAGLPMDKAVSITSRVIDNYYLSQETGKLSGKLEEGRTLGASMREQAVMPDILTDMTAVGEETGEMVETLNTVAGYYDAELEQAIKSALAKLEPTLLIGIAAVAGFIVVSVYLAMFSLYGSM